MDLKELIAKYGLIVILCIALLIIGVALYLWKKDEKGEDDKKIATAGIAMAITGGVLGLGSIAYNALSTASTQKNSGTTNSTTDGEDVFEESA